MQRKATTAKSEQSRAEFAELENSLADVVATATMEEIPLEVILNWDRTEIEKVSLFNMDHGAAGCQESRGNWG